MILSFQVVESVLSNPSQTKDSDQVQNQPFARDQLSKVNLQNKVWMNLQILKVKRSTVIFQ